ncbi:MAG: S-layer homology domain-containing protein [Clostridiales Family XIII bacterium]|jgi:hypothetical protein|nr:S-layer homology domain-containing protein [Clostridiales Family XIII bacterium]
MKTIGKKSRTAAFRLISLATAFVLCATGFVYGAAVPPDIAGKPYERAVTALADKDVITGDPDGNFYPDTKLTRAQICTIIVKAMQAPIAQVDGTATQDAKKSGFPDMLGYDWAEGYIAYAVERGVVAGYPEGDFRPGNNVTMNELITMTMRAAGYIDSEIGGKWPENYIAKAGDINALDGITAPLPQYADKWMAAQLVYNVLSKIEAMGQAALSSEPSGSSSSSSGSSSSSSGSPSESSGSSGSPSNGQGTQASPASGDLSYISNAKFDANIHTFNGKEIASNAVVYTYKIRAEYRSGMELSDKSADYLTGNVYKYKNVETPAWYETTDGKISKIIMPNDVGFSGYAYGVINGISKTSDGENNAVDGFSTLSAGREILWQGSTELANVNIPGSADYTKGQVYEFRLRNGKVVSVASVDGRFNVPIISSVKEIGSNGDFTEISEKSGNVLTLGDDVFEMKEQVTVYYLSKGTGKYSVAGAGSVHVRSRVRMYDVSDDKNSAADIVIVEEN